jgi:hypothetical protein
VTSSLRKNLPSSLKGDSICSCRGRGSTYEVNAKLVEKGAMEKCGLRHGGLFQGYWYGGNNCKEDSGSIFYVYLFWNKAIGKAETTVKKIQEASSTFIYSGTQISLI